MLHITLKKAREADACIESYRKFAKHLGGVRKFGENTPIPLITVLDVMGLDDTIWCLRCTIENSDKLSRLFACDCAEHVLPIFEAKYPNDKRPRNAIEVSRKYACGQASIDELTAAWDAARDAAWATAWATARDAEKEWQTERLRWYLTEWEDNDGTEV